MRVKMSMMMYVVYSNIGQCDCLVLQTVKNQMRSNPND